VDWRYGGFGQCVPSLPRWAAREMGMCLAHTIPSRFMQYSCLSCDMRGKISFSMDVGRS
jgi:hypothetical protein